MAFDLKNTILLEKKYLYVRASLGFQLEGTSREIIPTNNGFYRFYVDNLSKALGNSYVNILHDSKDLSFQSFCSDLYMDELMSSDSSAIEDVVLELQNNTLKIQEFESGVSSALASNHLDNVAISSSISNNNLLSLFALKSLSDSPLAFINPGSTPNATFYFDADMKDLMPYYDTFGYFTLHKCFDCYCRLASRNISIYLSLNSFSKFSSFKPYSYSLDVVYLDSKGNLKNSHEFNTCSIGGDSRIDLGIYNISGLVLKIDVSIHFQKKFLNLLSSFCGRDSYSMSSFNNNVLVLYSVNKLSCCLFQNFNYDFTGGYLDFRLFSSLSLDFLNSLDFVFLTDVGKFTFSGSSLGLVKSSHDSDLIMCTNLPNFVAPSSFTISKLIGISVSKSDGTL